MLVCIAVGIGLWLFVVLLKTGHWMGVKKGRELERARLLGHEPGSRIIHE